MVLFTERHADKIAGTLSCYDRLVLMGTIPGICYAEGMTRFLQAHQIRIFDFPEWAKPLREEIRQNAERLAAEAGLEIEFVRKLDDFRKERRIKDILKLRGEHPGLVHIFAAMESCRTYKPWHNKKTHQTYVKPDSGRCLHYYFYFIDPDLGLCYLRVPTWAPFRLQFYFNGHGMLAQQLRRKGIGFDRVENAFVRIDDFEKAQALADQIHLERIHRILDQAARRYCPVIRRFAQGYHWSIMQAEYALDLVFQRPEDLKPLYEELVRTLTHAVKPDHLATFLGRKLHGHYEGELGSRFSTRMEGTCLKHYMGDSGLKMYDKFGVILRLEGFTNDVTFFQHYRKVEHRDGTCEMKQAPMRKTLYSLPDLAEALSAANRRYLEFLSAVEDPTNGIRAVQQVSRRVQENDRSYKGFNLFDEADLKLFRVLSRGEFNVRGLRSCDLCRHLPATSPGQVSHLLRRLRNHGILKKAQKCYRYYVTSLGKRIIASALKLREMFLIPSLRGILS